MVTSSEIKVTRNRFTKFNMTFTLSKCTSMHFIKCLAESHCYTQSCKPVHFPFVRHVDKVHLFFD